MGYDIISYVKYLAICNYYKLFGYKTFLMDGKTYHYFYHKYNHTWRNERTVEIPIVCDLIKKYQGKAILEVGNVLSNYFSINHDVLDKYDNGKGVIKEDVIDFKSSRKYDLIVSISTLEHVGWDEEIKDSNKILNAIENLKSCLADMGILIITIPLGYNSYLDTLLKEKRIDFTKTYFMKRITSDNKWAETAWEDVKDLKFSYDPVFANGLIIGIIKKETT